MLIKKPSTPGDIVSVKLANGEELIARLDEETAEYVKLNKPKSVTLGGQGLGMIPFMFLGDDESITIKQQHILTVVVSKKDAADQYLQGTTGIALA